MKRILATLALATSLHAGVLPAIDPAVEEMKRLLATKVVEAPKPDRQWAWKLSLIPLVGAQAADLRSSLRNTPGVVETNGLYGNQFGVRDALLKSAIGGVSIYAQWRMVKAHPRLGKVFAVANFGMSVLLASVAAHNKALAMEPQTTEHAMVGHSSPLVSFSFGGRHRP